MKFHHHARSFIHVVKNSQYHTTSYYNPHPHHSQVNR